MHKRGFAKSQFVESFQRTPWLSRHEEKSLAAWPTIDHYVEKQKLSDLDEALTRRLLQDQPDANEKNALFLCHLILAAKAGHICIKVHSNELIPPVQLLWKDEEGDPLKSEEAENLTSLILEGAVQFPKNLLSRMDQINEMEEENFPQTAICLDGENWYLQKHWVHETLFLTYLKRHLASTPFPSMDVQAIKKAVNQLCVDHILLEEQAQAILQGCLHPLSLVTGGPGTGKTYTAGHLIKLFWNALTPEQKKAAKLSSQLQPARLQQIYKKASAKQLPP